MSRKLITITLCTLLLLAGAVAFKFPNFLFSNFYFLNSSSPAEAAATRTGLVGWWTMDGNDINGTSYFDKSGFGNTATSTGSPAIVAGKIGQAAYFDTTTDWLDAGDVGFFDGLEKVTFSLWIKPITLNVSRAIFQKWSSNQNSFLMRTQNALSDEVYIFIANAISDGGSNYFSTSDLDLVNNVWTHLVIVYDGTLAAANRISVYKNTAIISGSTGGTLPATLTSGGTADFTIGGGTGGSTVSLPAMYDDVRVYNRALSATEVAQLYSSAKTSYVAAAPTASSTPTSSGRLVGHWTMDSNDISGTTVYDKSGNNNHGITVLSPTIAAGKVNQAMYFSTVSKKIDFGNPSQLNFGTGSFSACAWAKSNTSGTTGNVIGKASGGAVGTAGNIGWYLNWASAGTLWSFAVFDGTNGYAVPTDASARNAGQWYHLCGTFDGSVGVKRARLYVDGTSVATAAGVGIGNIDVSDDFGVNGGFDGFSGMVGYIDDVRVYNYALSAQEVAQLYTSAKKNYTSAAPMDGLVGHWTLDNNDTGGTTVYDKSGRGKNGTVTGAVNVFGKIKEAMSFDGADDIINTYSLYDTNGKSYSLSTWINMASSSPAKYTAIMSIVDSGSWGWLPNGGFLQAISSRIVYCSHYTGSAYKTTNSVVNLPLNEWSFITCTYDSSAQIMSFYVNGVSVNSAASVDPPGQSYSHFQIGGTANNHSGIYKYFQGSLDDVRFYNRALSAQEVAQLYNSAKKAYIR